VTYTLYWFCGYQASSGANNIISRHIGLIVASRIVFIVTSALVLLLWTIAAEVDFIVALLCLLGFG
jgi:hypothetical protein